MKVVKALLVVLVVMVLTFLSDSEYEAVGKFTPRPRPAGDQPIIFITAYRTRQTIKLREGINLHVIGCRTVDRGKNYEFALNFVANGQSVNIKGMSLYVFSAQPEPEVQVSYENANQWTHMGVYEPAAADQIIDEHGGPNSFYGLNYAWLVGACFIKTSNDMGVIFLKTPIKNRLKFIIETYVLVEN